MAAVEVFPGVSAAILFDADGNLYTLTDEARRLIESRDAIELRGARLHALDSGEDARLQRLIDACTRADLSPDAPAALRSIAISGRSSQLTLCFTPLTEQVGPVRGGGAPPRALALVSASVDFGLTAAENAVADLLWCGLPLREIAEQRGTSVETVRTQTKAIYAKLGVQSRGQMMAAFVGRATDSNGSAAAG